MKLKPLVLAMAALSAGAANAASIHITGTSAVRGMVARTLSARCSDVGGSLTVYKSDAGTSSFSGRMAYQCTLPIADGGVDTVYHTTSGDSLSAIHGLSNDPAKQQQPVTLAGCAAATAGTGDLAGYSVRANCPVGAPMGAHFGVSDVESNLFSEQTDALTVATDGFTRADIAETPLGLAHAYGLAVSEKMYEDLQSAQGIIGKPYKQDLNGDGDTADAGETGFCATGDSYVDCQPSLSRADITSLINNNTFAPQKTGAQSLGLAAGASIEYARDVATAGSQKAAEAYFLGKGCLNGQNSGQLMPIGDEIGVGTTKSYGGQFAVSVNSGTGGVINALRTAGNTRYAVAFLSGGQRGNKALGWQFVKLNGVPMSEGTATATNKKWHITGVADTAQEMVIIGRIYPPWPIWWICMIWPQLCGWPPFPPLPPWPPGTLVLPDNPIGATPFTNPGEVSGYQHGGSIPNTCQPSTSPF